MYRYLNPVYASQGVFTNLLGLGPVAANEMPFPKAVVAADPGASTQDNTLVMNIAADVAVMPTVVSGADFSIAGDTVTFAPRTTGALTDTLQLRSGVDITLSGTGVDTQKVYPRQGPV